MSGEYPEVAQLEARWSQKQDGETGFAYGEALVARGQIDRAAEIYNQLIAHG